MELLLFAAAFGAEVLGTSVGFGSSTIFLPLAVLLVDFKTALVLVAVLHVFGNGWRMKFFRQGLDRKMLVKFGVPSMIFTLVGAWLVGYISQSSLRGVLGVFLVGYAVMMLWKGRFKIKQTPVMVVLGGGGSGFLAGLIGTGGAVRGAVLTGFGLPKKTYIATAAAIALAVDVTRIPVYLSQGFLTSKYYWYIPVLLMVAGGGSFIGKQMVTRIPQKQFRKLVLGAILLMGLKLVYDWLFRS